MNQRFDTVSRHRHHHKYVFRRPESDLGTQENFDLFFLN